MGSVELWSFPEWTEDEDLRAVIESMGHVPKDLRVHWDAHTQKPSSAVASFGSAAAAGAVAAQLQGFEFTPGWPLHARAVVVPRLVPALGGLAGAGAGGSWAASGKGGSSSSSAPRWPTTDYSPSACIGAGRIEGWFVSPSNQVEARWWGNVQSLSFQGNLVFRLENSQCLWGMQYKHEDPVTFEVVQIRDGTCEAVHLALPGQEADVPAPSPPGAAPWDLSNGGFYEKGGAWGKGNPGCKGKAKGKGKAGGDWQDQTWGNDDGKGVFFGGLGAEMTDERLEALAASVGTVTFAKVFRDVQTGVSKGCGKVFFTETAMADRALEELAGTELYGKKVTVEVLGQESEKKKRKRLMQEQQAAQENEEVPQLLPVKRFTKEDTLESKLDLCSAAFEDLLQHHDVEATGKGMVWMVRSLIKEVNDVLDDDIEAKQAFGFRLKQHPWFPANGQLVRWQASRNRINISKASASTPMWKAWQEEKDRLALLQREGTTAQGMEQEAFSVMAEASKSRLQQLGAWAANREL